MPKKSSGKQARLTPLMINRIVEEIAAYGRKERADKLTWSKLSDYSGFTHKALWERQEIKVAYAQAKAANKADATPVIMRRTVPEQISRLNQELEQLRTKLNAYDERWVLLELNMQRLGIAPSEMLKPGIRPPRERVRNFTRPLRRRP